jgi:hypothetical protein
LENILSWGYQDILDSVNDVADLELIAYNKIKKTIAKQTQRKRRIDLDNTVICAIEEQVLDTKRAKLIELLSIGLAITHDTLVKAQSKVLDVQNLEKKNALLENHVKYYKSTQGLITIFIEHVLKENESNAYSKEIFMLTLFNYRNEFIAFHSI